MSILNLTQHPASPEQIAAGVVNLTGGELEFLKARLTFNSMPTRQEIEDRAHDIALLAASQEEVAVPDAAMIGGAPYLMSALESALLDVGIKSLYAFSVREVEETQQPDGSVKKTMVFRHLGFVEA